MLNQLNIRRYEIWSYLTTNKLWYIILIFISLVGGFCFLRFRPEIIIGVLTALVLVTVLFYYPYVGVLAYIVFEYARIPAMFPELQPLQLGKWIVILTLLIWIYHYAQHRSVFIRDKINWLMLAWLALAFLSSFFALEKKLAVEWALILARWVVVYIIIFNLVDSLPKWQGLMWLFLLLNLKLSQFQIRSFRAGYGTASDQYGYITQGVGAGSTAFFSNATDFGAAMCVIAPFAFYLVKATKSKILKAAGVVMFLAFVFSILQSGSRGAAMALFAMAFIFWFKSSKKLIIGILVLLFVLGFWVSAPLPWKERFVSAINFQEDPTASSRINFWKAGIKMFKDHPLTGVGMGNFGRNFAELYDPTGQRMGSWSPHSIFVQAGAELGIGGLAILLLAFYSIFKRNRETREMYIKHNLNNRWVYDFAHALDLSLVGFIVSGTFLTILYYPHLYIIMALALSLNHITQKLCVDINPSPEPG
jgi:probable O-glycosylation ligase (exosortase A-associated)